MVATVQAVYEGGMLRLLEPVGLQEGQVVEVLNAYAVHLTARATGMWRRSRTTRRTSTARMYRSKTGSRIDPGISQFTTQN